MIERYTLPEMGRVWTDQRRFERWLAVEIAACEVLAEDGLIPREAMEVIRAKAGFDIQEIDEIERETQHDVIAFITSVARHVGPEGRFVHQGLTSSDVVDTAFSLVILEAIDVLATRLAEARAAVREQAVKHAKTPQIGRTHGMHAEPTTFGLKLAVWYQELKRHEKRLAAAREEIAVGKISGAVGNYSSLAPALESRMLARLGLAAAPISNQVLQRDRHAAVMSCLGGLAATIEKFATEIRGLARSEVREVQEPFGTGQKGSSAMPHKKNPIVSERLCGMARLVRGHVVTALENVALWHERDISHSSAERVIFPDAFITLHYMLVKLTHLVKNWRVYPARMRANLDDSGGIVFSGKVLLALTEAGYSREEAYVIVQGHAMAVLEGDASGVAPNGDPHRPPVGFRQRLEKDPKVAKVPGEKLDACFALEPFLTHADEILKRALE